MLRAGGQRARHACHVPIVALANLKHSIIAAAAAVLTGGRSEIEAASLLKAIIIRWHECAAGAYLTFEVKLSIESNRISQAGISERAFAASSSEPI